MRNKVSARNSIDRIQIIIVLFLLASLGFIIYTACLVDLQKKEMSLKISFLEESIKIKRNNNVSHLVAISDMIKMLESYKEKHLPAFDFAFGSLNKKNVKIELDRFRIELLQYVETDDRAGFAKMLPNYVEENFIERLNEEYYKQILLSHLLQYLRTKGGYYCGLGLERYSIDEAYNAENGSYAYYLTSSANLSNIIDIKVEGKSLYNLRGQTGELNIKEPGYHDLEVEYTMLLPDREGYVKEVQDLTIYVE